MLKGTPNEIMNQKFMLELKSALAMENAGVQRLQARVKEASLPEAKQKLYSGREQGTSTQIKRLNFRYERKPNTTENRAAIDFLPPRDKGNDGKFHDKTRMGTKKDLGRYDNRKCRSYVLSMLIQKAQMAGRHILMRLNRYHGI